LEAIKILNQSPITNHQLPVTLVVVCARNVFSERLRNEIVQKGVQNFVNLVGFIPDDELSILYQEAEAFVFPTLSEGFGLPGLEAMAAGCPVICSDIPVLKEIYQDSAIYFNPLNSFDMVDKIKNFLLDKNLKIKFSRLGLKLVKKYSWNKLARETLAIYQSL
jgi:glycosyltransferase involved in cell wall biosynthesis